MRLKAVAIFWLVVALGVLIVPWTGVTAGYAELFRGVAGGIFATFGRDGIVHFREIGDSDRMRDTEITMEKRGVADIGRMRIGARYLAYVPTALVVSLILATPTPWRRRSVALAWGLMLIQVYIVARIAILLVNFYTGARWLYSPSQ